MISTWPPPCSSSTLPSLGTTHAHGSALRTMRIACSVHLGSEEACAPPIPPVRGSAARNCPYRNRGMRQPASPSPYLAVKAARFPVQWPSSPPPASAGCRPGGTSHVGSVEDFPHAGGGPGPTIPDHRSFRLLSSPFPSGHSLVLSYPSAFVLLDWHPHQFPAYRDHRPFPLSSRTGPGSSPN